MEDFEGVLHMLLIKIQWKTLEESYLLCLLFIIN